MPATQRLRRFSAPQLENFMCHENFFLRFGPHVTFINGTNGSGKSAILQGLQFCLGMQAAKTGRAGVATPTSVSPHVQLQRCVIECMLANPDQCMGVCYFSPCSP